MRFFSQSFLYDDPWSIVSLAFFLRYPNPYASHILSCDVISREFSPSGSLLTTRLILKQGALPRWFPKGIVTRAESWVVEESEVDPDGKVVRCLTRNLDHVKVMQVQESQLFRQTEEGKTLQKTEASIVSGFGWGLTKQIENHGLARFKKNVQRSREGVSLILNLIRQARLQPMTMGASYLSPMSASRHTAVPSAERHGSDSDSYGAEDEGDPQNPSSRTQSAGWFR
ncbi:MSF1-domain-containing protein [Artomyces pyxidatus]|uniref:MSF1-domain-containing protein n=1 Tax=Artomyces pyxidatus TaxID=48021 RepID=A0ACB8THN0_9AGAM|nr:MSF1-domain-containing protein [Artomyces pyxidatus]